MNKHLSRAVPILAALAMTTAAGAQQIYATNNLAGTGDGSDELIVFDAANPSGFQTIGSTGVANIGFGGLDFDRDGNLWGYASFIKDTGGAAAGLYSFDTATGAATPVGVSFDSLQDIAYNPADNTMYGINTRFQSQSTLYSIDLGTGAVTSLGLMSGLPAAHHLMGFAIDSAGNFFVQDLLTDALYVGDGTNFSHLRDLGIDTNFSQGMTIDWSRDDTGYHGAVGYGVFPDFFSTINTFTTDGSSYNIGPDFGPNDPNGVPPVEPGDLAIRPVPTPGAAGILAIGALGAMRRRR